MQADDGIEHSVAGERVGPRLLVLNKLFARTAPPSLDRSAAVANMAAKHRVEPPAPSLETSTM